MRLYKVTGPDNRQRELRAETPVEAARFGALKLHCSLTEVKMVEALPEPDSGMTTHTEQLRSGNGVRVFIADDKTDSLAIITVRRRHGELSVESGLRGNFDAHRRPIQRVFHSIRAPLITRDERNRRKAIAMQRFRFRP